MLQRTSYPGSAPSIGATAHGKSACLYRFLLSNIAFNFKGMDVAVPSSTATLPSLCPPLTASRDKRNKDGFMCSAVIAPPLCI